MSRAQLQPYRTDLKFAVFPRSEVTPSRVQRHIQNLGSLEQQKFASAESEQQPNRSKSQNM